MKRIVIGIVAAIGLAALLLFPRMVGDGLVRELIPRLDARFLVQYAGDEGFPFTFAIRDVDQGWFSTRAQLVLQLDESAVRSILDAAGQGQVASEATAWLREHVGEEFRFDLLFEHGPILPRSRWFLGVVGLVVRPDASQPVVAALQERLQIPQLVQSRVLVRPWSTLNWSVEVPRFAWEEPHRSAHSSGARLTGSYHPGSGRTSTDARIDALVFHVDALRVEIEGFRATSLSETTPHGVSVGTSEIGVARFFGSEAGRVSDAFELGRSVLVQKTSLRDDGHIDAELRATTERAVWGGEAGESRGGGRIALAIRGVPAALMAQHGSLAPLAVGFTDASRIAGSERSLHALADLLRAGPSIEIGPIEVQWGEESLDARAAFSVHGDRTPRTLDGSTAMWLALLLATRGLEAEVTASEALAGRLVEPFVRRQIVAAAAQAGAALAPHDIDAAVRERTAGFAAGLESGGFARRQADGRLRSELTLEGGQLRVNGAPLSLFR